MNFILILNSINKSKIIIPKIEKCNFYAEDHLFSYLNYLIERVIYHHNHHFNCFKYSNGT